MKESRRIWMKRLLWGGAVLVLGAAGYSRREAEQLLRRGLDRLDSAMNANSPSGRSSDSRHDPYYRNAPIPNEREYKQFLAGLGLRYFRPEEIIRPHRNIRKGVQNTIPPKELWSEMESTLKVADELRHRLGARVTVLSGYRSMSYNRAVGGASRSQHTRNRALDLKFSCSSDEAFQVATEMREEGFFHGGIGWYPSFVHVDTRGHDATWGKG